MLPSLFVASLLALSQLAFCKDVYLNWTLTWVNAAPDGFERPVIGINGEWPCPQVDADEGDRIIADVYNALGNQSSGIHWHGIHQVDSIQMDGPNRVTQCPLQPGQHMRYDFQLTQTGTYWYHSHEMGQYPDGLRGPLVVHEKEPLGFDYDEEITLTVTDWYHKQMGELLTPYETDSPSTGGHEPLPDAILINESINTKIHVEPGKTYLVRMICMANFVGHSVFFEDHDMTIVEVDGVFVEPHYVPPQMIRMAPGHRWSVLLTTKSDASRNYGIVDSTDMDEMFGHEGRTPPDGFNSNATAWLVYNETQPLPPQPIFHVSDASVDFVSDLVLLPVNAEPLLEPVDRQIIMNMKAESVDGRATYMINNQTYEEPDVPTLYTAISTDPEEALDPATYGPVNAYVVRYNEIVEIVINNYHTNLHAWHLHGYTFQVLQRATTNGGYFEDYFANVSSTPVQRDTIMVEPQSHLVLRFRAENPGVWLLHCHTEFHVETHLSATIIVAPDRLQDVRIPEDHWDICSASVQEALSDSGDQ